ncbi:MAG: alpha/beta hydrolase [Candidatus Nitrosocaldus sp.]|nr:alpha/beta hydrolase [Candidatus Nitrosocaldus sp.]MCS7141315.1 alpha/beta hydrolase [Candidatus Nitrosocaldus sp.]MDW8000280.1 alpha/beta hydrolase [Candidatus Nitrosocaldus sp.]MDW8274953.1 alpha/beta hydrolase [Candidatus Nitrosocaldus sp.]
MRQEFVTVNNYRVRLLEDGISNSKHIMLLHGIGAAAERWAKVIPLLAKGYHVVAPDIIGFGYSDKPDVNYTMRFFTSFVRDLALALGIKRFSLVGSSLGGQIATEFAIAHSNDMLNSLVLVTPSGMSIEPTQAFTQYVMAALYPNIETARKAFTLMHCGKPIDEVYLRDFVNRMMLPNAKYAFISTLMGMRQAAVDLKERLHNINVPTLIIWSEKDLLIPVEHAYEYQRRIRNSRLIIMDGCGHTPFYEQPERFVSLVSEFIESVLASYSYP